MKRTEVHCEVCGDLVAQSDQHNAETQGATLCAACKRKGIAVQDAGAAAAAMLAHNSAEMTLRYARAAAMRKREGSP